MTLDPDIDEAHKLKGWYDAQGRTETFQSHANVMGTAAATGNSRQDQTKTVAQIRDENLGMSENADYFNLKATTIYIKQDSFCYPACLSEGCNKKVIETDPGEWRCEKCNIAHPKPEYRYIMSINVSDHTGTLWLSCFDDVGRMIMGMSADELMAIKEEGDEKKVLSLFSEANCKTLVYRCRAKMDTFKDEQR